MVTVANLPRGNNPAYVAQAARVGDGPPPGLGRDTHPLTVPPGLDNVDRLNP